MGRCSSRGDPGPARTVRSRISPRGLEYETLALIEAAPATRAADLAAGVGRDTPSFKRDVRKLKELGLTESLEVGYRLSPRGQALVRGPERDRSSG